MNIDTIRKLQARVRDKQPVSDDELREALAFLREDRRLSTKTPKVKAPPKAKGVGKPSLDDMMGDLFAQGDPQ